MSLKDVTQHELDRRNFLAPERDCRRRRCYGCLWRACRRRW